MTDQQHPITPPPELVQEWLTEFYGSPTAPGESTRHVANRAAQWSADTELEAIIRLAGEAALPEKDRYFDGLTVAAIRAVRRPKPPSLKEQALEDLEQIDGHAVDQLSAYVIHGDLKRRVSNIRRALEALPDE